MLKAVITGVAGQDGSYLAEYLIEKGYHVTGVTRRHSTDRAYSNISKLMNNDMFEFVEGDITDSSFVFDLVNKTKPDEWYNLAAQL